MECDDRELKDLDEKMRCACAGLLQNNMDNTRKLMNLNDQLETKIEASKKKKYKNYPVEDFIAACKQVKIEEDSVLPPLESVEASI